MTEAARHLWAPLGQLGSGRVRYGAAMALWQAGAISAEVLEVYRVAAAHDTRDPMAELRARGLPLPIPALPIPALPDSPLAALYDAARAYLLALDHPGRAEVRAALPPAPPPTPTAALSAAPSSNEVVRHWLGPALESLSQDHPALAATLAQAAPLLHWGSFDGYPSEAMGAGFAKQHGFAPLLGRGAPFQAKGAALGLFLLAPGLLCRDHHHPAAALYAPLTGPHGWRFAPGRPLIAKPAHQPIWTLAHQSRLTKVGSTPLLCFYVRTKDVVAPAQLIPAADWPYLETVTIA